jgi:hypothetical protein
VRQQDQGEIRDALRRLGSSESEALLYKGTVSVEGIHDVEIIRSGFDDIFRRHMLRDRGGRGPIERAILELQGAEKRGDEIGFHCFIFDHDRRPTALAETPCVRLLQLNRFCLENYLLDADIITDITREKEFSDNSINNTTETRDIMKRLAIRQLDEVAARASFVALNLESVHFDMSVLKGDGPNNIAGGLWSQIEQMQAEFSRLRNIGFVDEFRQKFDAKRRELLAIGTKNGGNSAMARACLKL